MKPYFGMRSGYRIKLGRTASLPLRWRHLSSVDYFDSYRAAYRYVFGPSFASVAERRLMRKGRLDLVVYTDGGQRNDNDGAWAYSVNDWRSQLMDRSHYFNTKNNNYCEVEAVIQALRCLVRQRWNYLKIMLDTDSIAVKGISRNVLHGISIQSIARNTEWQLSQLRALKQILRRFPRLRIKKVKGHSGIVGNQLVHQLCSRAMVSPYSHCYDPFMINRGDLKL